MLERVAAGTLVIVPGDREDVILALTTAHLTAAARAEALDGWWSRHPAPSRRSRGRRGRAVLTGGYGPRPEVLDAIRERACSRRLVDEDTYTVASEVHDLLVKTHAADAARSS